MTHRALRHGLHAALAAALIALPMRAWAQVVINNDEDTPPAPSSTSPAAPAPAPAPAAPPAPADTGLGLTPSGPAAAAPPAATTDKTKVDVGAEGVKAGYTKETLERVKEPPSTAVNVALDLGAGTILGLNNVSIAFANVDLKVKILAGGQLPGSDGGSWNGVIIEPQASALGLVESYSAPRIIAGASFPGNSTSKTIFGFQGGAAVGWQFLTFGAMNENTLKQNGFGFELGGYLGATGISPPQGSMQINASYGPVVGFTFPTYNAGTAKYSSFAITLFVLPTGDGSTLVSGTLGFVF